MQALSSLKPVEDWKRSLPMVLATVKQSPVAVTAIVSSVLTQQAIRNDIVTVVCTLIILSFGTALVSKLICSLDNSTGNNRHRWRQMLPMVFHISMLYFAGENVFLRLLILPGIWWSVKSSLGAVFVCFEEKTAVEALSLSHKLTEKQFWQVVRYLAPFSLLFFAVGGWIDVYEGCTEEMSLTSEHLCRWHLQHPALFFPAVVSELVALFGTLSLLPLQVNLYRYLKAVKGEMLVANNSMKPPLKTQRLT